MGRREDLSDLEALRTRIANEAASLAEAVGDGFAEFHLGAGDWVVELTTPEGPSTGGGATAMQHLRLVPRRRGYAAVVAGSVNAATGAAELRTFEHVAILHELRFDRPLEITAEEYDDFLRKADVVLNLARMRAARAPAPASLLAERAKRRAQKRISVPALALFVLVVALAAVVVYRVLVLLRR